METSLFSKGDIKTYELEELKGKTLEIVAAGGSESMSLIYGRDIETDIIYVIQAKSFKKPACKRIQDIKVDTFDNVDFSGLKAPIIAISF